MKQTIALAILNVLSERNFKGQEVRPGGGTRPRSWKDADNVTISVVPHGDMFDFYIGSETVYNVAVSRKIVVRFAWWILSWWMRRTWCGFKFVLWDWAAATLLTRSTKKAQHDKAKREIAKQHTRWQHR